MGGYFERVVRSSLVGVTFQDIGLDNRMSLFVVEKQQPFPYWEKQQISRCSSGIRFTAASTAPLVALLEIWLLVDFDRLLGPD